MQYQTLHLIARAPLHGSAFTDTLEFANKGDAVLLYQDAVLELLKPNSKHLAALSERDIACFALKEDLDARGLHLKQAGISPVDYAGFVALVEQSQKTCSWF